jgi:uncharacterized protein (DUF433 family)
MSFMDRIEINPRVCNGKPVIKGTRIPITVILDQIAEGNTWEDVLAGYPELTIDDIKFALQYARLFIENSDFETVNA